MRRCRNQRHSAEQTLKLSSESEGNILSAFRQGHDSVGDTIGGVDVRANDAFVWLKQNLSAQDRAVILYNHPSRKVTNVDDLRHPLVGNMSNIFTLEEQFRVTNARH
ncbi:MAG TPA: hypothetical protein EYO59_13605 [Chromatiaceae bacterium]|nr:hypothetical protein [Chromatiaceae bacterium]